MPHEHGLDATFQHRERQHLHQDDARSSAQGVESGLVLARPCRGQAMEAATTPGRYEPCFAGRTSCFGFFRMADLPTEQEFMQGQDISASRSTEGSALAKGLPQTKHDVA